MCSKIKYNAPYQEKVNVHSQYNFDTPKIVCTMYFKILLTKIRYSHPKRFISEENTKKLYND